MLVLTHINADKTYSVRDTSTGVLEHFKLQQLTAPILGVFRRPDGSIYEMHPIHAVSLSDTLKPIIFGNYEFKGIKTPQLRDFANHIRLLIPKYFFKVSASSSSKHHPASNNGLGGLVRHTKGVCRIYEYMTSIKYNQEKFNDWERDCMLIACMMHDFLKSGWDEDYEKSKWTVDDHPLLAANAIRGMIGLVDSNSLELIAHCIESHMGQWNTNKNGSPLPIPIDEYQLMVHMSDFLSSKPDINLSFGNAIYIKDNIFVKVIETDDAQIKKNIDEKEFNKESKEEWYPSTFKGPKTESEYEVLKQKEYEENRNIDFRNIRLSDADKGRLQKILQAHPKINQDRKRKCGIDRTDDEVYSVWEKVVKTGVITYNMQKYMRLALGKFDMSNRITEAPKTFTPLKDNERARIMQCVKQPINSANKEKLGISADDELVLKIWNGILEKGQYSEKQEKYVKLAML